MTACFEPAITQAILPTAGFTRPTTPQSATDAALAESVDVRRADVQPAAVRRVLLATRVLPAATTASTPPATAVARAADAARVSADARRADVRPEHVPLGPVRLEPAECLKQA